MHPAYENILRNEQTPSTSIENQDYKVRARGSPLVKFNEDPEGPRVCLLAAFNMLLYLPWAALLGG